MGKRMCLILSALLLALAVPATAADPKPAKEVAIPDSLKDPDFDKYLDIKKLSRNPRRQRPGGAG